MLKVKFSTRPSKPCKVQKFFINDKSAKVEHFGKVIAEPVKGVCHTIYFKPDYSLAETTENLYCIDKEDFRDIAEFLYNEYNGYCNFCKEKF